MKCAYSENGNSKCQFEHLDHILSHSVYMDEKFWCPFHAPIYDKDGYPTRKGDWLEDSKKWFYSKISELRQNAIANQDKLDLSGVVFPKNAKFQGIEFPEVDFSQTQFNGIARFENILFRGNANFHEAKFEGQTLFQNTAFEGRKTLFSGAKFHSDEPISFSGTKFLNGDFDFRDAEFSGKADFTNAKFNGGIADFQNATFKAGAQFEGADFNNSGTNFKNVKFKGKAYFRLTKFKKDKVDFREAEFLEADFSEVRFTNKGADFQGTRFNGRADFRDTYFEGNVIFQNAQFIGGEAIFWDAKFQENADFSRTKFIGGDAWFNRVTFNGQNADFSHAEFSDRQAAQFPEVIFNSSAIFVNTRFSDWGAHFLNTEFNGGYADFQNARFEGDAIFLNAQFRSERIQFQGSCVKGYVDFTSPGNNSDIDAFHGEADFSGAEFLDNVSFNNRKFRQETSFKACIFHKAPRFHDCQLHQETDFIDARFLDTASPGSAMAYRTLKQDMEEKRARQEQLRFYALEMKSRRSEERRKFLKFISWLYEATSDYGQRIFLPLAWLGFLYLIFTLIYAAYFKELLNLDAASILPQSLHFSIRQIIRPFGVFASSSLSEFFGETPSANLLSLPLIIAASLQSFLSLALLLLSALAARWRFKIG